MLKIEDSSGKIVGTLKDEDSEPKFDQDMAEFWAKVNALVTSGKATSISEAKEMVLSNKKNGE